MNEDLLKIALDLIKKTSEREEYRIKDFYRIFKEELGLPYLTPKVIYYLQTKLDPMGYKFKEVGNDRTGYQTILSWEPEPVPKVYCPQCGYESSPEECPICNIF